MERPEGFSGKKPSPSEVKLAERQKHVANNRWTYHNRKATVLADEACEFLANTAVEGRKNVLDSL